MSLLKETRVNHLGKLAFRWAYWNVLLPGRPMPIARRHVHGRQEARRLTGAPTDDIHDITDRSTTMPVTTIDGHEIHVDDEGFMTEYDEWDEELGAALADAIGVEMTDEHWKAIRFLREDFKDRGRRHADAAPRLRPSGGFDDQDAVRALPEEAGQEDGLHRRTAQARRLRLTAGTAPTTRPPPRT